MKKNIPPVQTVFGLMQYTPSEQTVQTVFGPVPYTRSKQNETLLNQTPKNATVTIDGEVIDIDMCDRFIEKFTKTIIIVVDALIQANMVAVDDLIKAYMKLMPETIATLEATDAAKVSFTTTLARLILSDKQIGNGIQCEIQEMVVDNIYPRVFH